MFSNLFFEIESLLSRYLFRVQSRFSVVAWEYLAYFGRTNNFPIVRGKIDLDKKQADKMRAALDRGEKRGSITTDFSFQAEPPTDVPAVSDLIGAVRPYVEKRLGKAYRVHTRLIRNLHFDERFENAEVYSNRWHQDSDLGSRQIKAFLALHDVGLADGPLTFLDRSATKKNWNVLGNRWSDAGAFGPLLRFDEENHFVAKRGDYVVVNTARNLHRASVPASSRDLLIVTFVPSRLPI